MDVRGARVTLLRLAHGRLACAGCRGGRPAVCAEKDLGHAFMHLPKELEPKTQLQNEQRYSRTLRKIAESNMNDEIARADTAGKVLTWTPSGAWSAGKRP